MLAVRRAERFDDERRAKVRGVLDGATSITTLEPLKGMNVRVAGSKELLATMK